MNNRKVTVTAQSATSSPIPAVQRTLTRRERIDRGKSKAQRDTDAFIQKLTRENIRRGPVLREIETKFSRKEVVNDVKCPNCGESTRGNRMNGVPWCFKCNQIVKNQSKKSPMIRALSKEEYLRRSLATLNLGLNPKRP